MNQLQDFCCRKRKSLSKLAALSSRTVATHLCVSVSLHVLSSSRSSHRYVRLDLALRDAM